MDLLIEPKPPNATLIHEALISLNLSGFDAHSFARLGLKVCINRDYYAELLTPSRNGPSFDEIAADARAGKLFGFPIRIASPQSLIRMKRQAAEENEAQRTKHLADIDCLERHAV